MLTDLYGFCSKSLEMFSFSVSLPFRSTVSVFAASVLAVGLIACSEGTDPLRNAPDRVGSVAAKYPGKSDADPHPGVREARGFAVHGIDVSKWQGEINWEAVKAAGTKFAFIKATEGGDHLDERFAENWNAAKAHGVPRSAYHFVYWCRPASEQAAWFEQNVPNDPTALPPVLDVEWNGHSRTCPKKIGAEKARAKIRLMLQEFERHTGKRPIIYTDITFHKDVFEGTDEFNDYPFWLRSVAAPPRDRYENRPWSFWQYTTTGRVPGIRGDVDRNVFAGTMKEWNTFLKQSGVR
jgi:lysozyme